MLASRALYTAFLGGMVTLPSLCNVYKSDVGKLCDSEQLSQSSLKADRASVFTWMEKNVASSEAIILVRDLEGKDAHGIGMQLRDEARKAGLTACALADTAEMQAKDDDAHSDLVNLCAGNAPTRDGSVAILDIVSADDAERMREMTTWTATNAKSQDTVALVAKMAAAQPRQRGALLRAEATRGGVTSCLMAATLDAPPPTSAPVDLHQVNPNFVVMKVDGSARNQLGLAHAMVQRETASAINTCYAVALAHTPTLAGKVALKLTLDPLGHVTRAVDDGSAPALKGPLVQCLLPPMLAVFLAPPTPEPGAAGAGGKKASRAPVMGDPSKATVTFQLTPTTNGEGWGATIDPAWFAKVMPKKK